jgi:hypothetical protein
MQKCSAYVALSLTARRIMDRLEIELAAHSGKDNGHLMVTYGQFVEYGIGNRDLISPALNELINGGFIEITQKGLAGSGPWRRANQYRLTYLDAFGKPATHEWKE